MTVQETVLLDRVTGERRGTLRIHYGEPASRLEEPPIDVDVAALIRDSAAELEMGAGEYIAAVLRAMHDRPGETAASILEEPRRSPAT